jgi:hypothetical protein
MSDRLNPSAPGVGMADFVAALVLCGLRPRRSSGALKLVKTWCPRNDCIKIGKHRADHIDRVIPVVHDRSRMHLVR